MLYVCICIAPIAANAQLSGSYSIGGTGATYSSISAALSALTTNGVSGPVVFNINTGTYNEDIYLTSAITGASSTNTITFRGSGRYKVILKDSYPLYLSNADYIRVEDLTLEGSTYGLYMSNSDYCKVTNCSILANATSTSSFYRGAYVYRCNYDTIQDCRIYGGYYGMYIYGTGTSFGSNENNLFENIDIVSAYYYGIYHYYGRNNTIEGCRIDSNRGNFSYRLRNYRCTNTTLTRNQMYFTGNYGYGIYTYNESYYPTSSTNASEISNNFIGGSASSYMYGIYMSTNGRNTSIINNTVVASGTSSSSRGLYMISGSGHKVFNNNFYQNGTAGYAYYISNRSYIDSIDYNNVHSNGTNYVYLSGARTSLSALKTYGNTYGWCQNSIDATISYTNTRDYLVQAPGLNNKGFRWVPITEDIEGNARPTSPDTDLDIGCNDYYLPPNDAGIASFPSSAACPGTTTVVANLSNYGTATLTSASVGWAISVDGGAYTSQSGSTFSGSLSSGNSTTHTLGSFNMQAGKTYTIKAWTSSPNSSSDGNNANDTSYTTMAPALAGTFTVGTSGNFSSIGAAVSAASANGVCGPVTFRLTDNSYNEQVTIPTIAGSSPTNYVRFVGQGADNTTIANSATSTSNWATIQINGGDYITFDSVRVEANGFSYGVCYWLTGAADHNSLTNSELHTSTTSTSGNFRAYVISSSTTSISSGGGGEYNLLQNTLVRGGYYGYYSYGSFSGLMKGNDIIDCQFYQQYFYPVYSYYARDRYILRNDLDSSRNSSAYGAMLAYGAADSIAGNRIIGKGFYNVYMYYANVYGTTADTTYFVNNMLSGGSTYGLYTSTAYRVLYYNNSFYSSNTYTAYHGTSTGSEWKNNSYHNNTGYAMYFTTTSGVANGSIDYNNYYAPNASNMIYYGGTRADLQAWQIAYPALNGLSISADPAYVSTTDLHSSSPNLNNAGASLHRVKTDFDGNPRPTAPDNKYDIGANDFYLPPYDLDLVSISPSVFATGSNTVSITVRNTGINDITNDSAYVSYARGNETPTVDTIFITSLTIGSEMTFDFASGLSVSADSSFTVCASIDGGITGDPDTVDQICENVCVGSKGTYTIDKSGNGDFKTFGEATTFLSGCGIAGAITFEVVPATYNEQVVLTEVAGASATNTITFIKKGTGEVKITNSGSSTSNWITVLLDGADHVTFENITIEASGSSYGAAVFLTNQADYNTIRNCKLLASTTATFATYVVPLCMSASTTSVFSYGNTGNYNLFEGNELRGGGYYGARLNGISGSYTSGNQLINNTFREQYYYGIYSYYSGKQRIIGNSVDSLRRTTGAYGAYIFYGVGDSIVGNTINAPYYGMYFYFQNRYGSTSDTSYVINNMISSAGYSSSLYGFYGYFSDRVYFVGNSIHNTGTSTSTSSGATRFYYCDDNIIKNNSVYRSGNGYALNFYYGLNPDLDNNNWYSPNATNPVYFNGTNYTTVAAYSTARSQGANSLEVDPEYVSTTNLRTTTVSLNNKGANMPQFNFDIDGNPRPASPDLIFDIGAAEYYLPDYDADVVAIGPNPLVAGNNVISATIQNNGIKSWTTADTVYLEYEIDGGTAVKDTLATGVVAPGGTVNFNFTVPYNQSGSAAYEEACINFTKHFKGQDPDTLNEEYCQDLCVRGASNLTIDANGNGDFESFTEAVDYLSCAGVSSPVRILVKEGTYNEQIEIPSIAGASSTNTIRFVGESHNAVITSGYTGTFGEWTTIRLNNASHITLDSLSIVQTDALYGWGVHLYRGSDYNSITNCNIINSTSTTTGNNAGIVASNSLTGYSNGDNAENTLIDNNRIVGGYYGVNLRGAGSTTQSDSNTVSNNELRGQYYYGMYLYYQENLMSKGNDLDSLRSTNGYVHYTYGCNRVSIIGNKVQSGAFGLYNYYMNYFGTSTSDTSYVVNNMVSNLGSSFQRGMYNYYTDRTKYLHNSVQTSHSSTSTSYASFYMNQSDNCIVMNNVFANTGGGLTTYINGGTVPSGSVDYNAYYAPSSSYIAYNSSYRTTLSAWQTATSTLNANSVEADPGFLANNDLHSFSDNINNKGNNAQTWATDFDGDPRPTSPDATVDMGADDYWIPLYDVDVATITSPYLVVTGNNDITATFQNRGLRDLNGEKAIVSYTINNSTPEYDTITFGPVAIGADTTYTFNTPWNNSVNGTFDICVGVDSIIGRVSDMRDEVCVTKCTGASDTLIVDGSGNGDYLTISGAINKLACGIVGPTVVLVKDGQYNESVTIESYTGVSSTNNIEIVGESRSGVVWNNTNAFATVSMNGAEHVSISNMTIKNDNTNSASGVVVHMSNNTNYVTIDNCDLIASTTNTNSNLAVITSSSNAGTVYNTGANASNISISDNLIKGGYYGVRLNAASAFSTDTNLVMHDNEFVGQYYYGSYLYGQENTEIAGNTVDSARNSYAYGMYSIYCLNQHISNNIVLSPGYGIYNYFENYYGSTSDSTWVYNNIVHLNGNNFVANPAYYGYYAQRVMVYHNTLVTTTTSTSTFGSALYLSQTCTGTEVKNNNLYAENSNALVYYSGSGVATGDVNNNNYYSKAGFNVYWNGTYSSLGAWQTAYSSDNTMSVSANPYFTNLTDLRAGAWQLMGGGADLGIAMDFEGETRDANMPDIGADEIQKNLAMIKVLSPVNECRSPGEMDSVSIRFENSGIHPFVPGDSIIVSFMEGAVTSMDTLVVPSGLVFSPGMSSDYTFRSDVATGTAGAHSLSSWVSYGDDSDRNNDTASYRYVSNPNPVASFTVGEVCEYETSTFKDLSTLSLGNITAWNWDFGNGASASSQNPGNDYGTYDTFMVRLVTTTDSGCVDTVYGSSITHPKPMASFSTSNVCDHSQAGFTNGSSVAYGSLTHSWDFGDNTNTSTNTDPTLTYSGDGDYNVVLIATSDKGCKDTSETTLTVYPTPNPDFSATEECKTEATEFTDGTSITSGSYSSSWDFGDGNTSSSSDASHTYAADGSYTVKLITTSTANGCADSVSKSVTVNPLPTASFTATNMCFGDSLKPVNNSSLNNGNSWDFGDGNTSSDASPAHLYSNSGSYTVKLVTTTNKGCEDSTTANVSVANQPLADFTVDDDCVHNSLVFKNATSVACGTVSTYEWSYGDGNSETVNTLSNPTHQYATPGTYDVQLVITLANNTTDTARRTVTVWAQPTASFTNSSACEGNLMQFTNTTTPQTSTTLSSFAWTFGDGGSSNLKNPTNTYTNSGSYTVSMIAEDSRACRDTVSTSLTISPNPVAGFTYSNACEYDDVMLTNTSTVSSGSISSYNWDFGNNTSGTSRNEAVTYGTAGFYTVKMVSTSDQGCKDSVSKTVQAYAAPSARFTQSNVCDNESMSFSNLSSGASGYTWNFGDNSSTVSTASPSYTYGAAGSYTVELVATTSNACTDTFSSSVSVYSLPTAAFTAADVCDGDQVSFSNGSSGASSYSWSYGDGQGSSLSAPKHTYSNAGKYQVQLVAVSANNCKDTLSDSITVNANPAVSISANDECVYNAVSFGNSSTGASSYSWNFGDGNSSTDNSPSNKYRRSGTYNVVLTATSSANCSTKDSLSVDVHPAPSAGFTNTTACQGDATAFTNTASISSGTMSHSWDFGDLSGTSNNTSPSYTYSNANTYTVELISTSNNGCADTVSKSVTVNSLPSPSFSASNTCLGTAMSFTNNSTGASTYSWNFDDGNSSTSSAPSHTYTNAGSYNVELTAKTSQGCESSTSNNVVVYALPVANFSASNECLGEDVSFNNLSTGATSYSWSLGDGNSSTDAAPAHGYASSGTYTVSLTATSSNSCTHQASKSVTVYALPAPSFTASTVCFGNATSFTNTTSGTNSYAWNFGDGTSSSLESPSKTYSNDGRYDVILTATSGDGCIGADTSKVTVNEQPVASFTANTVCATDSTHFTNASTGNIFSYNWRFGNGATSKDMSPGTVYTAGGTYQASLQVVTAQGCNDQALVDVTVHAQPTAAFTTADACLSDAVQFADNGSSANGGVIADREWMYGDGNNDFGRNASHMYSSAGIYTTQMVVSTINGCTDTASTSVEVFPLPEVLFTANDTCEKTDLRFTNSTSISKGSVTAYNWMFGDGNSAADMAPTHSYDTLGTYTITLEATSDQGCINSSSSDASVFPNPDAFFVTGEVCDGDSTRFQNHSQIAEGEITYSWDFGDGSTSTDENPWHTYTGFGVYDVTMLVTSNEACANSFKLSYEVHETPVAAFPIAPTVCLEDSLLIPQAVRDAVRSDWMYTVTFGDGSEIDSVPEGYVYAATGTYSAQINIESDFGCMDSANASIEVLEIPTLDDWSYTRLENGEIQFNATATDGVDFSWDFGDGNTSSEQNPSNTFTTGGATYEVSCTVTNAAGCTDVITKSIEVYPIGISEMGSDISVAAYPNPYKDWVKLSYELHKDSYVRIELIDMQGRLVSTLVDQEQMSGAYVFDLYENDLQTASGNMVVRLVVNNEVLHINLTQMR